MIHPLRWRPPVPRGAAIRRPQDHRLPVVYRLLHAANKEKAPPGEFVRYPKLAQVEAALFVTEEPQTAKKLAALAGLTDAAEVRRLIGELQELYERDGSSFQVEEIGG